MADTIQFIETDPDVIVKEFQQDYENLAGRKLQPGQAETLLIQAGANRLHLQRLAINDIANLNLVRNARGGALELLGELLGVVRLPSSPAECLLEATLVSGHGDLVIAEGLRVQSVDGQLIFITTESKEVDADTDTVTIKAKCTVEGSKGNDYAAGEISVVLDPLPYLTSFVNTDTTNGGSDEETDEELRERIKLAPASFSVAGPSGAYKYFAKSAHPLIIDVAVADHTPDPGDVTIYVLLQDGEDITTEIEDAVYAACNAENVRPLNDTVIVEGATNNDYEIEVNVTLLTNAVQATVEAAINEKLEAYAADRKTRLGVDVVINQIIRECMVAGVYDVEVVSPGADVTADVNEFTKCTGITVNITGTEDE